MTTGLNKDMTRKDRITTILTELFSPTDLAVIDESGLHAGHQAGMDGSGETHFAVHITAPAFATMSRIDRHRAVNAALKPEFDAGLHALSVDAQ